MLAATLGVLATLWVRETFLLYPVQNVLLLYNTTRAHTPDPQAQMTEVWPTERYKYSGC